MELKHEKSWTSIVGNIGSHGSVYISPDTGTTAYFIPDTKPPKL